jgi:hypothetical protein
MVVLPNHHSHITTHVKYAQKNKNKNTQGLLFLGAAMTLTVLPCSLASYVYKNFDAENDEEEEEEKNDDGDKEENKWELSALPSVCGAIDPRRFACIALCGQVTFHDAAFIFF